MISKILLFFRTDLLRKAFALLLAILLYTLVSNQLLEERQIHDVPVKLELTEELLARSQDVHKVKLKVKGPKHLLQGLSPEDISGVVPITPMHHTEKNIYRVKLTPDMFRHDRKIHITEAPELRVFLQRKATAKVRVHARFTGKLAEEYKATEIRCIPSEVNISGPEDSVRQIRQIHCTVPLAENNFDSFEYESKLQLPPEIQASPDRVMVQVNIARKISQRIFDRLPILILQRNADFSAEPETPGQTAEVILTGAPARLEMLKQADIRVFADLSNFREPGIYTCPLSCSAAIEGIAVKAVIPGEIKIKVIKSPRE